MALYNFRKIDVNTQEGKRKLIDTFVNSIFLYDDRLKIVFNGGAKNEEISLSELESSYSIQAGQPEKSRTPKMVHGIFVSPRLRWTLRVDSDAIGAAMEGG